MLIIGFGHLLRISLIYDDNTDYYMAFKKFSILIGWKAVRKNPYPDRGPYFPYLDRCPGCRLCFANRKTFCFLKNLGLIFHSTDLTLGQ
jgi:hypothetical protein